MFRRFYYYYLLSKYISTLYNMVGKQHQLLLVRDKQEIEFLLSLSELQIMYNNRLGRSPWQCCWAGWDATIKTLLSVGHQLGWYSGCLGVQSPLSTTSSITWVCMADSIDSCHVTKNFLRRGKDYNFIIYLE